MAKRMKLDTSEPCSICKKHVDLMYELEDNTKSCHSCGIKSLTRMAFEAGESRRQKEKAKQMMAEAKKELVKAKKNFKEREKERVKIEKEYERLSLTLGVVVANPFADASITDLKKSSPSNMRKEIEKNLRTLGKRATEEDLGPKDGFGHEEVCEESTISGMSFDQLRDVTRLLTLGFKKVNLKFDSDSPVDEKFGEWTIKFDTRIDYDQDKLTLFLNREGANEDFSFEANVQIVDYWNSGDVLNEDYDSDYPSTLENDLQKIEYTYDKTELNERDEERERRGGFSNYDTYEPYVVIFNITVL